MPPPPPYGPFPRQLNPTIIIMSFFCFSAITVPYGQNPARSRTTTTTILTNSAQGPVEPLTTCTVVIIIIVW
jgi:hypothetical protein